MPPRKRQTKIAKSKPVEEEPVEQPDLTLFQDFDDQIDVTQLDLIKDLNDEFFSTSNRLIQVVAESVNAFVAGKLKRYVDLLALMHTRYVGEVESAKAMKHRVHDADEKLRLALETTATSESMFDHLRDSLAEAWRAADAAENREALMQRQVIALEPKENLVKHSSVSDEDHNKDNSKIRGVVLRERDRLAGELREYQKRLELQRYYSETLETIIETHRITIGKQKSHITLIENEKFKIEHKQRVLQERFNEDMQAMQKELATTKDCHEALHRYELNFIASQKKNQALRSANEQLGRENYNIQRNYHRVEEDKAQLHLKITLLEDMAKVNKRDLEEMENHNRQLSRELKKNSYVYGILKRRFQQLGRKNIEINQTNITLQNDIYTLEKKLAQSLAQLDDMTHMKDDIFKSREKLRLDYTRMSDLVASMKHDAVVQRNSMQGLQNEYDRANKKLDEKEQYIQKLNKEKHELIQESNDLNDKIETLEETLLKKTDRLALLNERLQTKHRDFVNMKKQMEVVHSEKVGLEKSLDVCTRDRQTLQNINVKMTHQVNQMTNEIAVNEKELNALNCRIEQLNSTIKQKVSEIQSTERMLQRTRTDLKETKIRNENAQHTIDQDEKRFKQMTYSLDELRKEKNLVGLQMVRRNDEVQLLKERINMLQNGLDRGTSQYNQRIEDIRLLKLEITNLRMSHSCMKRALEGTANMRQEVVRLERTLNRERLRVTAFTEEMARPCRIHRWRVLLGRDPKKFDLIRKIQVLLKRNIRLNLDRVNADKRAQDVQRLYDTLKQQLKHIPDPSIKAQLNTQQRINRNQIRKLKAMKAELAINEIDLKTRDCIIESYETKLKEQVQPTVKFRKKRAVPFNKTSKVLYPKYELCLADAVIQQSSGFFQPEKKSLDVPSDEI
ncbi:cilia- and flagella-associated protein 58 [Scaptodrosophila lebanonensis]|uniref:Cilia- and flagella-associated protein 58 n=1 Tax=Drosophila lebanonensis TaxID=7225 RepID=A0A6J2T1K3_DROLE|nr:cilia- and flagella-associated protein 58 [Scaptodrosophila lebanonensis]